MTAHDEIRDANIVRIAAIFPDGDLAYLLARLTAVEAEVATLRAHILDIDAHATPYGDIPDDPGWVGVYLLSAGALHRALGKIGYSAASCQAEALLSETSAVLWRLRASAQNYLATLPLHGKENIVCLVQEDIKLGSDLIERLTALALRERSS